jgi:Holliday junction resolvase RusA-like endonuclease
MIDITLACIPPKTSHHAKQIIRRGRFARLADTPALNQAKDTLDAMLVPHQPPEPVRGDARLHVEFTWPWLVSDPKRVRAAGRIYHGKRPDCSNVLKTLEDRLVKLRFLEDDGQVVEVRVSKYRGAEPGIRIQLSAVYRAPIDAMGMSTRAIAPVVGVSHEVVARDTRQVSTELTGGTTGLDGKTYKRLDKSRASADDQATLPALF